ncbi:hypothetical protein Tco_1068630 [Tanacetum coccineum]|uniref:Uncharacterized protein n=1 Tax=Tanacetum coccineum TaxID=301880 RepID=A0ABQ5HG92_9ASTR
MCGLTTTCRHPDWAYNIKDQDGNVIDMDTFLQLLVWTGTITSKGDPILDNQRPEVRTTPRLAVREAIPEKSAFQKNLEKPNSKIVMAREKKDQQNLAKAQAKRARKEGSEAPQKKRKVHKNPDLNRSSSEKNLSPTPLHHANPKNVGDPLTVVLNDAARAAANVEKEVVDLSTNSFHSAHHEDTEEGTVDHRFMSNWGLRDDLRICTFRVCKELVSHLATPAEEEVLGNLTNVKVIDRIKGLEEALAPKSVQLAMVEGKVKVLEDEKVVLLAKLDQAEKDRHKLVWEFILTVVKKLYTSIEYRQSLAASVSLCFTMG